MKKIVLILLLFFSFQTQAQEGCTENLYNANKLFEKGQFSEVITLAERCTSSENPTDRWKAYRLLAMAYLANNQQADARKAAEKMKEINPSYKPSSMNDPAELVKMLTTVKVIPKLSMIATTLGYNVTFPSIETTYNGADYSKSYEAGNGWSYGLLLGYSMNERISLGLGLLMNQKSYSIDYQAGNSEVKVDEKLNYLNVPLFARFYTNSLGQTRLFADVGIYGGLRTNSESSFSLNNPETNTLIELNNLSSNNRRNDWEYGGIFGAGVIRNMEKFDLALDVKYYKAEGRSITNGNSRYENSSLLYNFYYLDDDLSLSQMAVSLSLVYNISYRVISGR